LPSGASMNNDVFSWTPDYDQSGEYYIRFSVNDRQLEDFEDVKITVLDAITPGDGDDTGKKGGCFIATAAYGSSMHPYVRILRDFRDRFLMLSKLGRESVNLYYKYSPFIASFIRKNGALKFYVRVSLLPLVAICYSILHFGPLITAVMFGFIFVFSIFFLRFYQRKRYRIRIKQEK